MALKTVLKAVSALQRPVGTNPLPSIRKNGVSAVPGPNFPESSRGPKTGPKTRLYANTWHVYANRRHKTLPFTRLAAVLMVIKPIHSGLSLLGVLAGPGLSWPSRAAIRPLPEPWQGPWEAPGGPATPWQRRLCSRQANTKNRVNPAFYTDNGKPNHSFTRFPFKRQPIKPAKGAFHIQTSAIYLPDSHQ